MDERTVRLSRDPQSRRSVVRLHAVEASSHGPLRITLSTDADLNRAAL